MNQKTKLTKNNLIVCRMYVDQWDYKGLHNFLIMNDYELLQSLKSLIENHKWRKLTEIFEKMIEDFE